MMTPSDYQQDVRQAAESLWQSNSQQQYHNSNVQRSPIASSSMPDISHSQSINTIPSLHPDYIISDDLITGSRIHGRMSNIRRFFCLFVTFDLLLTGLMWLICVMLKGENIMKALSEQIYHYNVRTSLFDIVLAALCRFVVLLLFYALIYMNHWIVIAISTTTTCVFLVAKVFLYDWPHSSQPVFEVLLVLISFVLSWGEAWFLDFRVLPQESHAKRYFITNQDSERAPLIRNYVTGLPSTYTESVANFYSPLASPEGSLYRFNSGAATGVTVNQCHPDAVRMTKDEEDNYKTLAARTMQEAWDLLHKKDWKLEKEKGPDSVYVMDVPGTGRLFKIKGELDISPRYLLEELFYRVDTIPQWNPALLESHKVQVIDERTDISYQVSANGGGGVVASRDFVSIRTWDFIDNCYIIANKATEHRSLPKNDKYVRGENRAGCWVMHELGNTPGRCLFEWVLNTNLNGHIPKYLSEKAFVGMMFDYMKHLRQYIESLRETGKLT